MTSEVIDARRSAVDADAMSAYAIANLRSVDLNDEIRDYLLRIDATLEPFGGRFLVHGRRRAWSTAASRGRRGHRVPRHRDRARLVRLPAYQAILPLRTRNAEGGAVIVDGVPAGYRAASLVQAASAG